MSEELLKFPCTIGIKAMGLNADDFATHIVNIVKNHKSDISKKDVSTRDSKNSKYLSVTITVYLESRAQADSIYMDLSADERVLMSI